MPKIVTRFAPSPTGVLHIGSVRTALFNFLYARQHGGTFILRIEDTDKERSKKEFEDNILDGLSWLGLKHDEFFRQSDRGAVYRKYLEKLIIDGTAYVSKEEPVEEGKLAEVIRFKNPKGIVTFRDEVRGDISFDTTELGDFVIAKDLDTPLYHFAVVADDFEMGVTHIIRGDDGISNTPRQILIQEALGAPRPVYTHLPMILASDKSKLSKRHGALAVTEYREEGYLPEAILNFVALMGWNPGNDQEVISFDEMLKLFSFEKIQKSGAVFNIDKLKWLNKHYLKTLPSKGVGEEILARFPEDLRKQAREHSEVFAKIIPIIMDRISAFGEVLELVSGGEIAYFFVDPTYEREALLWKDEKNLVRAREHLDKVYEMLQTIPSEDFVAVRIKDTLWDYATSAGRGNVLWPLRYALSGRDKSPDPFFLADILGKETTLRRIEHARRVLVSP
ncbi:MAG: glutamyl-tRNA synthetase [Parcubacteria group bacterium GW2011_GWA1_47_8]|nr:MAG: glutamyl-tRNA synthetase [Parcubacteria group bacterium GW2011_GWA1_47_8]KKW07717.1 MAG: glutamyl-tRNA synthetase [Parcubacteria group bacterium GW2011_GWA2_49_16]